MVVKCTVAGMLRRGGAAPVVVEEISALYGIPTARVEGDVARVSARLLQFHPIFVRVDRDSFATVLVIRSTWVLGLPV